MEASIFTLKGKGILELVSNYLRNSNPESYISEYKGGFIVAYEDYSFLNSNDMMICLRLDSTESDEGIIKIEMISGGGSNSLGVGALFGSESRRISDFEENLRAFCSEKNIVLEL